MVVVFAGQQMREQVVVVLVLEQQGILQAAMEALEEADYLVLFLVHRLLTPVEVAEGEIRAISAVVGAVAEGEQEDVAVRQAVRVELTPAEEAAAVGLWQQLVLAVQA